MSHDARQRILTAAGELFAERGFDATPTSRIAERAGVPKGLIHYYFRRKQDLLTALVEGLPEPAVPDVAVRGDLAGSLRRLVREFDARPVARVLWREADTHAAVRDASQGRFRLLVEQIRAVIATALPVRGGDADVDAAALLLARALHQRAGNSCGGGCGLDREIGFIARALRRTRPA
ncbi:TetR/AcrR family transcriptional regulator [Saccharopolyspora sp. CA-218241]|uniref:TetR/AcrR family transcriptional regulator n=1 Tax=Saccharopolyspora sp. CA-218241 TaxID=3240027 RepID=UPI003D97A3E7